MSSLSFLWLMVVVAILLESSLQKHSVSAAWQTTTRFVSSSSSKQQQQQQQQQQQRNVLPSVASRTTRTKTLLSTRSSSSSFLTTTTTQQKKQQRLFALCMSDSSNDDGGWAAPKSAMIGGAGVNNAGEPPFEIRGFSLGNLVCLAGVAITFASFAEYLAGSSGDALNVSGLGFIYGLPIFLAGAALKYAEIEPVPVFSTAAAEQAFLEQGTDTILKIKQDVTRHRYGDEAHLDTTVKKLGLVIPGKAYPQLQELRQSISPETGELIFTMVWQSLDTPYKMWADERRVQKYETFFGPNVAAQVLKIDAEQRLVGIQLTILKPQQ